MTDADKEKIIGEALNTDYGKTALSQSLVEPIRKALAYDSFLRRMMPPFPIRDEDVNMEIEEGSKEYSYKRDFNYRK